MNLERFLLKTMKQIHIGEGVSGVGFALYIIGAALRLPDALMALLLTVFALIAVWTMLSMLNFSDENEEHASYNLFWGQGALTILLVACAYLTIRSMIVG
jgi:tellurite resistance protein TehA-like permease